MIRSSGRSRSGCPVAPSSRWRLADVGPSTATKTSEPSALIVSDVGVASTLPAGRGHVQSGVGLDVEKAMTLFVCALS